MVACAFVLLWCTWRRRVAGIGRRRYGACVLARLGWCDGARAAHGLDRVVGAYMTPGNGKAARVSATLCRWRTRVAASRTYHIFVLERLSCGVNNLSLSSISKLCCNNPIVNADRGRSLFFHRAYCFLSSSDLVMAIGAAALLSFGTVTFLLLFNNYYLIIH